jgi:hypothetical protein
MSATEKVRREKWINEKTKKIKEITVRGGGPPTLVLVGALLRENSSFSDTESKTFLGEALTSEVRLA